MSQPDAPVGDALAAARERVRCWMATDETIANRNLDALVAAARAEGAAEEREACCKDVCWWCERGVSVVFFAGRWRHPSEDKVCGAHAIRARAPSSGTEAQP